MARSSVVLNRMSAPVRLCHLHMEEAQTEKDAAITTEEAEHHDRAWAAYFTAKNMHLQSERLRQESDRYLKDSGWHERQLASKRQYFEHPDTGEMVHGGTYFRLIAEEHLESATEAAYRAAHWHDKGTEHSALGRAHRAEVEAAKAEADPPTEVVADAPADEAPANGNGRRRQQFIDPPTDQPSTDEQPQG
jgi:hypothetical protein